MNKKTLISQPHSTMLTDNDVLVHLDLDGLIRALTNAFRDDFSSYRIPPRLFVSGEKSTSLLMPCYGDGLFGLKVAIMNGESGRGARVLQSTYTLYDEATGDSLLFLEAGTFTDLRTAAVSAVATFALALPEAQTLGIFGTGRLARAHVPALFCVRPFREVFICGSSPARSKQFAESLITDYGIAAHAVDAATCARESEVLCACTTSREPLFDGDLLQEGAHLNLVGAFTPETREVDTKTILRSRVVVDTYGALEEAGDLLIPLRGRDIRREHVLADLHQALSGRSVREHENEITVFKSVGSAIEDIVAAKCLLAALREPSLATR
jgi:ornithine cyclodeaminase/alanine dehydrogenase-like protein (mu-crystallin family)